MMFEEADLTITNCTILPMNNLRVITQGLIAIKDRTVTYVGNADDAPKIKAERMLDGRGKLAMPGLVNCHTHLAMTLFRGLAEDVPLETWLNDVIWPMEKKLKPKDVHAGALLGCLEMIKNGTTCFADMYFFESEVAQAVETAGLRAALASGIIEAANPEIGEEMLREAIKFAGEHQGLANGRITTFLGPHAVSTCSRKLLTDVREKAAEMNLGIHIHLAESKRTAEEFRNKSGFSEVEFLDKLGFLGDNVLAAHCIHLTRDDMAILARNYVKVAHNPIANMKLAQGITKVKELMDLGVIVGLGTDGAASNNSLDMFESMKVAALLQKTNYRDPTVFPAAKVLEMATVKGSETLGLQKKIGSIEVGKHADLILIDLEKPHLTPLHDLFSNLVYSTRGCDVDSVIVDGETVMENREVKTLDEEKVIRNARNAAFSLLER